MTLGDVIRRQCTAWGEPELPLERALLGTEDPDAIAACVDAWCVVNLGSGVAAYDFFDTSSGSVHGVRLRDRRRVVVKGHRATVDPSYVRAVQALQRNLADIGYPAPRPLVAPAPFGEGFATAETLLDAPRVDAHDPVVRDALATGLATFVTLAAPHRDAIAGFPQPMAITDGELYPPPHSARFDFAATAGGAEWIDEFAAQARERLRAVDAAPVLTHGDWRIENVRVADGQVVAVYDWDSVQVVPEAFALAPAATTFPVDWAREGRRFPRPPEIAAFVKSYEAARGHAVDHDALAAAMVASLAYGARCEHCVPHFVRADDSQTALLRTLGLALLDHGLTVLGSEHMVT